MIEIEIDGKKLTVRENSMIIEAADNANIYIPRFCYHKKLSIAANCRMCLVEVEKAPKTLPACATPVTPGMKVFTQSEKALASQRAVMEFLLINHPLDCPICDQGGECELQDLALGYGRDISRFAEGKRSVKDKNLGPLVATEMTRCIYCTRCVRFGTEIAGLRELGGTGRGEDTEIGTYVEHTLTSELSGNIIDLCPVGALTSKPFRFTARAWEMRQHEAIAPHDCLGANIYVHTRRLDSYDRQHVMRVVPRENETINETWASDRDRFSYEGLHSNDRLTKPLVKINGQWQEVDWVTALNTVVDGLKQIKQQMGAKNIAAIASPNSTVEEFYLLQKLLRGLGSNNIDHRIRESDFSDQDLMSAYPNLGLAIAELENLNALLLIGADLRQELPLANQRIRKIAGKGGQIMSINAIDYDYNFNFAEKIIVGPELFIQQLARVAKALLASSNKSSDENLTKLLADVVVDNVSKAIAQKLLNGEKSAVLLGAYAQHQQQASTIRALALLIAELSNSSFGFFSEGANTSGAWLTGAIPHRDPAGISLTNPGLHVKDMLAKKLSAYLLLNLEPEYDFAAANAAVAALKQAQLVVVMTSFDNKLAREYADVMLPVSAFTETSGTLINVAGQWQTSSAIVEPLDEARPAWKVLRVLGNLFTLPGFDYTAIEEILAEIKALMNTVPTTRKITLRLPVAINAPKNSIVNTTVWSLYKVDSLVRRAPSLQKVVKDDLAVIRMNSGLAKKFNFTTGEFAIARQGDSVIQLPVVIDDTIAGNQIVINAGIEETAGFGEAFAAVELQKLTF